jgi:4-hydroxyproline epimerase
MPSASSLSKTIQVIDSHTAGEPTRVVLSLDPEDFALDLGTADAATRLAHLRDHHDHLRSAIVCEPRGSEVVVGALLSPPLDPANAASVLFFNDVGYLGMCGHGTIGVITTLAHLGRITPGIHTLETPVGTVQTTLHPDLSVSVDNVPSYRYLAAVTVDVPAHGPVTGDIAWGGNWFFLVGDHGLELSLKHRGQLIAFTAAIRSALIAANITGLNGALIDHIELYTAPHSPANSSRNFVLCPGASFDRSPCGTGTSAKMACEYAAGRLDPGQPWRQEGILDTVFTGSIQPSLADPNHVLPTITGRAWITAESTLLFDPTDPFRAGIQF